MANKSLLLIGGTYFLGRVFTMMALQQGYKVSLMNRGTYSMKALGDVTEYRCDRRDLQKLETLQVEPYYDAIIDFCAYEEGDIYGIVDHLHTKCGQYIYISTADVTAPSSGVRDEQSPTRTEHGKGQVFDYLWKKLQLETEVKGAAQRKGFAYTIIRPAFIFGPFNYAPRESWYIKNIIEGRPIPHPSDATGKFQMVYVKDAAQALFLCVENPAAQNQTFILSGPDVLTYDSYVDLLKSVADRDFKLVAVTVDTALAEGIPFPFPLTAAESELFDGSKITRVLGLQYSDLKDSMEKTYRSFRDVYKNGEQ